ncbi:MAG: glycosyltransferase [Gemmatimonadetes bacterium]|nr:glycosyltransferase [Gemmatimonadota bacterium]
MTTPDGVAVIVSTYDAPAWLEKVLLGFSAQTSLDFEIVIADDGSGLETAALVERMRPAFPGGLQHLWQEDRGFQKSAILNLAIVAAREPYLIFTDGDCIPRSDFVRTHRERARAGRFLSGGYVKLPDQLSRRIDRDTIVSGRSFDAAWLREHGLRDLHGLAKLWAGGPLARLLEAGTPTRATWNGHNSSGWKRDLVAVNGFDERMQYGGQDRELGERLIHSGIRPIQIRYSAITLHMDHARGYKTVESLERNRAIRRETRTRRASWTDFGIVQ